ncbi:25493_t:CDS:2 [Gigaspora rosea]|nr:25493_t:CDS:2 [Gigaspora rosea]
MFAEAVNYKCTPAQCRLLFCRLILEGMAAQSVWQNYHALLSADYISKKIDIQQGENEALIWIASFLEENGSRIMQFGLPKPSNCVDEITRIQSRYCDYTILIMECDKMILDVRDVEKHF